MSKARKMSRTYIMLTCAMLGTSSAFVPGQICGISTTRRIVRVQPPSAVHCHCYALHVCMMCSGSSYILELPASIKRSIFSLSLSFPFSVRLSSLSGALSPALPALSLSLYLFLAHSLPCSPLSLSLSRARARAPLFSLSLPLSRSLSLALSVSLSLPFHSCDRSLELARACARCPSSLPLPPRPSPPPSSLFLSLYLPSLSLSNSFSLSFFLLSSFISCSLPRARALPPTTSLSLYLSLSQSLVSCSLALSGSLSLSLYLACSLFLSRTPSLSSPLSLARSFYHTHTHTHTLTILGVSGCTFSPAGERGGRSHVLGGSAHVTARGVSTCLCLHRRQYHRYVCVRWNLESHSYAVGTRIHVPADIEQHILSRNASPFPLPPLFPNTRAHTTQTLCGPHLRKQNLQIQWTSTSTPSLIIVLSTQRDVPPHPPPPLFGGGSIS